MEATPNQDEATSSGDLAPGLKTFLKVQVALVFLCLLAELFSHFVLHLGAPFDYPLKTREQSQWDFVGFWTNFECFRQPNFFIKGPPFLYPAPIAVAYWIFYSHPHHQLRLFLGFIVASFVAAGWLLGRALVKRGVVPVKAAGFIAISLALAYPVWFDIKQGNIEICVWVVVALGVWAFFKNRGYSAALCFGIAGAMKFFPLVYLGLLLSTRKYRQIFFALFVTAVTTVTSVWFIGPNFFNTWRQIDAAMEEFRTTYMLHLRPDDTGFDHSLFGLYKRLTPQLPPVPVLGHILTAYLAIAAIVGIALYFARIRRLPLINQVLCLSIASILLPPVSYDYTLMHLYIPWALLVLFAQRHSDLRKAVPGLTASLICLAILVSPESEFIYHRLGFGGQIKAVVLVILMYLGLRYPFADESAPAIAAPL